jgi:DNA-binding response OmpR family regulator
MERKKSLLIVEDEDDARELIATAIETLNYFDFIVKAKDGLEATLKLANQDFDLILMDINIPKKNALEVLKGANRDKINPSKVIIMSGELDKQRMAHLLNLGIRNYIVKPLRMESLLGKVQEVIKK